MSKSHSIETFDHVLYHRMVQASRKRGGSHDTRDQRERAFRRFCTWLRSENLQYRSPEQIKARDVRRYFDELIEQGLGLGSLQNRASYLRVGIPRFRASNQALGISGRSRLGKHKPCPDGMYRLAFQRLEDDWARALLMLQRSLGLRRLETIRSGPSIRTWLKQLSFGDQVTVIFGTKGGRPRITQVPDRARAVEAVQYVAEVQKLLKRTYLVPSLTQRAAANLYTSRLRNAGLRGEFSSHSLRCAFACELLVKCARDGYSEKEAYALVSMSLGHGDGRGRYVKAVYCRYMPPYSEIQERAKAAAFQRLLEQGVQWSFASCEVKWSPLTDNSPMTKGLYESYSFIDLGF